MKNKKPNKAIVFVRDIEEGQLFWVDNLYVDSYPKIDAFFWLRWEISQNPETRLFVYN